ncbi:MAG: hypothetical protein ABSG67_15820 [Thermoguttaceae bacterium]|jgi:hypothetical protein
MKSASTIGIVLVLFAVSLAIAADDAQKFLDLDAITSQMKRLHVSVSQDDTSASRQEAVETRRQEVKKELLGHPFKLSGVVLDVVPERISKDKKTYKVEVGCGKNIILLRFTSDAVATLKKKQPVTVTGKISIFDEIGPEHGINYKYCIVGVDVIVK